jgi:hypothetical protein
MHSTQSQQITSRHNELFRGPLWRHKQTDRQSLLRFLICQGLKNIKALITSLLLELAEIEFWPAFVWFRPTVHWGTLFPMANPPLYYSDPEALGILAYLFSVMCVLEPQNVGKSMSKYKWVGRGILRVLVGVKESPQSGRIMKLHQLFNRYSVWWFSLAIWNCTSLRLDMTQSADKSLIGPSMVANLSWLYSWPRANHQETVRFLAHVVYVVVTYYKALSAIDYVDFMRRRKWKFYHSSSKLTNFGNSLDKFEWCSGE